LLAAVWRVQGADARRSRTAATPVGRGARRAARGRAGRRSPARPRVERRLRRRRRRAQACHRSRRRGPALRLRPRYRAGRPGRAARRARDRRRNPPLLTSRLPGLLLVLALATYGLWTGQAEREFLVRAVREPASLLTAPSELRGAPGWEELLRHASAALP